MFSVFAAVQKLMSIVHNVLSIVKQWFPVAQQDLKASQTRRQDRHNAMEQNRVFPNFLENHKQKGILKMEHCQQVELRGVCGNVAEQEIWRPLLMVKKFGTLVLPWLPFPWKSFPTVFIDFRNSCAGRRCANYPNPYWRLFRNLFFCCGNKCFCKIHGFLCCGKKWRLW